MAKLTLTCLLFFVFLSFSHARFFTDRSEHEVSVSDSAVVEDSDSKPSIFLPSEKFSNQEVRTTTTEESSNPSEITTVDTAETVSDPLVVITFRPINRQFGRSVPLTFRRGRHGCHHHNDEFKPWRLIDQVGRISYGNDMIVPNEQSNPNFGENWGSDREIAIPSKLSEFRHVGPWDSIDIGDLKEDRKHLHDLLFHHHHHHHHEEQEEEKDEEQEQNEEKSGFITNFRKFLNQFEF